MSSNNPKQKTGGLIVACVVAILMGIRFAIKGLRYTQIEDFQTNGIFLLLCGLILIALSIVIVIRGVKKNSKKE